MSMGSIQDRVSTKASASCGDEKTAEDPQPCREDEAAPQTCISELLADSIECRWRLSPPPGKWRLIPPVFSYQHSPALPGWMQKMPQSHLKRSVIVLLIHRIAARMPDSGIRSDLLAHSWAAAACLELAPLVPDMAGHWPCLRLSLRFFILRHLDEGIYEAKPGN